jgi:hypothetical protein
LPSGRSHLDSVGQNLHAGDGDYRGGLMPSGTYGVLYIIGAIVLVVIILRLFGII